MCISVMSLNMMRVCTLSILCRAANLYNNSTEGYALYGDCNPDESLCAFSVVIICTHRKAYKTTVTRAKINFLLSCLLFEVLLYILHACKYVLYLTNAVDMLYQMVWI